MCAGPWVNRRRTLRRQAELKYPGKNMKWICGKLHFIESMEGTPKSIGLVPDVQEIPKGWGHKKPKPKKPATVTPIARQSGKGRQTRASRFAAQ